MRTVAQTTRPIATIAILLPADLDWVYMFTALLSSAELRFPSETKMKRKSSMILWNGSSHNRMAVTFRVRAVENR